MRVDPLHEEANALLIDCHRELGERAAAIRQFEQLRARLHRELGVPPMPETEARYRELLAAAPSHVPAALARTAPPPAIARSAAESFAESVRIYRQHYAPAPLARALHAWSQHAARAAELHGEAAQIAARIGLQLSEAPH